MARLYSCGFELQSTTAGVEWDTAVNSTNWTGSVKHAGDASLLCAPAATTAAVRHAIYSSPPSNITLYQRVYVYIDSAPDGICSIMRFTNSATNRCEIRMNTNRTLELWNATAQVGSDSAALSLNTWYCIELKIIIGGASIGTDIEGKIDGTAFATAGSQAIGSINSISVGVLTSRTATLYFDDWACNDNTGSFQNDYCGAGGLILLKPDGAGATSAWRPTSGANYTNVDEIPPNDGTDIVDTQARNANDVDEYTLSACPAEVNSNATIKVVHVGARFLRSSNNTSDTFQLMITAGGNTENSATIQPNSNTTWRTNAPAVPRLYPITLYDMPGGSTTAFTKSDLDSTTIGLQAITVSNTADAQVTSEWLYFEYENTASETITPDKWLSRTNEPIFEKTKVVAY
jgi:hypothetical protein